MERLKSVGKLIEGKLPWGLVALIVAFLATLYPWPADRGEPLWFAVWGGSLVVWIGTALAVLRRLGLINRETLVRLRRRTGSRPARKAAEVESGGLRIERPATASAQSSPQPTTGNQRPASTAATVTIPTVAEERPMPVSPLTRSATNGRGGLRPGKGTIIALVLLILAAAIAFWPAGEAEPSVEEPPAVTSTEDVGVPKQPEEPVKERPVEIWPDWRIYAGYASVLLLVGILIAGLMVVGGKEPPGSALLRRLTSLRRREEE